MSVTHLQMEAQRAWAQGRKTALADGENMQTVGEIMN